MKDKKFYLEKANGKIQLKMSHKYFYQVQGQMFCTQLKRVDFAVYFGKNVPLHVGTNVWWKFLATNLTTNWVFLQKGCCFWIDHPESSKRWKIVSTWWLEQQIKNPGHINSHTSLKNITLGMNICLMVSWYV